MVAVDQGTAGTKSPGVKTVGTLDHVLGVIWIVALAYLCPFGSIVQALRTKSQFNVARTLVALLILAAANAVAFQLLNPFAAVGVVAYQAIGFAVAYQLNEPTKSRRS